MQLDGKVALVTGGARGIGRAICLGLAGAGATVVVNDLPDADLVEEVVAQARAAGGDAIAIRADVADQMQVEAMVAEAVARLGRIDILVNNAGVIIRDSLLETSAADWRRVFGVNIDGCFHCTQAGARHMVERGGGQIINISSANAVIGVGKRSCYAATKGAIESFTRCCALELAPHGIQVNAVAPGFTMTDINARFFNAEVLEALQARLAIGRIAEPEEVARTVVALAAGAMPYLVGQVVRIDGGWSSCDLDYGAVELRERVVQ